MEHEQPGQQIDIEAIAAALGCMPERRGSLFEYRLSNDPLGLTLRLSIDPERGMVSLYLRGATTFLGFVHITGVIQAKIDEAKGEVNFVSDDTSSAHLTVQRNGVFLVTRHDSLQ